MRTYLNLKERRQRCRVSLTLTLGSFPPDQLDEQHTSPREELGVDPLEGVHSALRWDTPVGMISLLLFSASLDTNGNIQGKLSPDVFKAPVEDLQLFFAEVCLLNKVVQPLWSAGHQGQFSLSSSISCRQHTK